MAKSESYSVAELEQMLNAARQNEINKLKERRNQIEAELAECDRQLEALTGVSSGGRRTVRKRRPGGGGRSQPSLKQIIVEVLQKSKKPLSTDDIVERVQAAGYRSRSDEFRKVVYLNLFNLKKSGDVTHDPATKLYGAA